MTQQQTQGGAAAKPWIEVRRRVGTGSYVCYATAYRKPLRVWVLGRWLIGGPDA